MLRPLLASLVALSAAAFSCDLAEVLARSAATAPVAVAHKVAIAAPAAVPAPEPAARKPTRDPAGALVSGIADHLDLRAPALSPVECQRVASALVREARARELEPLLVLAIVEVESGFDSFAVSPAGAVGLMQILPETGEALARRLEIPWDGARTLFDPVANVTLGIAYLEELLARYGDLATALAAYNWGPSRIDRRLRLGRSVPVGYSRRVLESYAETGTALEGT